MAQNPVEQRLADLARDWLIFRDDDPASLLIWQVADNARRLVAAFFESQKYASDYATGDLFIDFDTPFEYALQYSRDLKIFLAESYAASVDALRQQGESVNWAFDPTAFPDSPEGFVRAVGSFIAHYGERIGTLVVVLQPESGVDRAGFAQWLQRVLATHPPRRLRFVLLDSSDSPRLNAFSAADDTPIARRVLALDGHAVAQETFAQEATVGAAGIFRNQLAALIALVERGSVEQVKSKARDALAFVRQQHWQDQEVVVRLLVAGALLKAARHDEAVAVYQASRQAAEQALAAGHPAGQKMILQTWFGEAGAQLAAGQSALAAASYRQAARSAQADQNLILTIEARRMAAYCHAQAGELPAAHACSRQALAAGASLKAEVRGLTSLPLAAMDFMRTLDPERAAAIAQMKGDHDRRLSAIDDDTDARALAAGAAIDRQTAAAIEEQRTNAQQRLNAAVDAALTRLVTAGDARFQAGFAQARALLGPAWPLHGEAAIPVVPPPAAEPSS